MPKRWGVEEMSKQARVPAASGFTHDGKIVVHPEKFAQMVRDGFIDQQGRPLRRLT